MTAYSKEEQKAHRKVWVEALRSGKYRQGQTWLHAADGTMCCLGVACELSGLGTWSLSRSAHNYIVEDDDDSAVNECMPPKSVASYFGLREIDGAHDHTSLDQLNDDGKTFAEIADIIEAEPEGLVVK